MSLRAWQYRRVASSMKIVSTEAVPLETWSYGLLISRNIVAARARARMSQSALAARMRALGYGWYPQTVGSVERGERRLEISELLAAALALETSIAALLDPSHDEQFVELPSGDRVLAKTVLRSIRHFNDGMVSWQGNKPRLATREPESWPETGIGRDLRQAAEGARAIAEFGLAETADWREREARLNPMPEGGWPEPSPPPRRIRSDEPIVASIVTSAKGVLIARRNDGTPPWTFIAGEVEPGEDGRDAAIREVKEETGCEVQIGRFLGERVHPRTGRTMIYMAARPVRGTKVIVGDEAELAEVRWASLSEALELLPDMFPAVRDFLTHELGERP
jgi:8-oxo-dGTP diphosphatase